MKGWETDWSKWSGWSGPRSSTQGFLSRLALPSAWDIPPSDIQWPTPSPQSSLSLKTNEGCWTGTNPLPWLPYFCRKILQESLQKPQEREALRSEMISRKYSLAGGPWASHFPCLGLHCLYNKGLAQWLLRYASTSGPPITKQHRYKRPHCFTG